MKWIETKSPARRQPDTEGWVAMGYRNEVLEGPVVLSLKGDSEGEADKMLDRGGMTSGI